MWKRIVSEIESLRGSIDFVSRINTIYIYIYTIKNDDDDRELSFISARSIENNIEYNF